MTIPALAAAIIRANVDKPAALLPQLKYPAASCLRSPATGYR